MRSSSHSDVLILGAGMAGLAVARALAERGLRVLVLEAQGRVGGRIHTLQVGDEIVELGAEFLHGHPPELWALVAEAGLDTYERDGAQLTFEDGRLRNADEEQEDIFTPLEELRDFSGPDCTFAEYLDGRKIGPEERRAIIGYVEGFNAADHREISAAALGAQQRAEDKIEGDRVFCVRGGYGQLPEYLAERVRVYGGEIRLNTQVESIAWQPGAVEVRAGGEVFTAARCVVALPLGVLQSGRPAIAPAPGQVLEAATRMRMGQVCRFTLVFQSRFWETLEPASLKKLSFLFTFETMPSVWWTPFPGTGNRLVGWVGGPRAAALNELTAEELGERACGILAKVFGMDVADVRAQLVACHMHDWQRDPDALGAYSYIPAGAMDAPRAMTEPVEDTLFFAGEHTDITAHWGTVHAALRSGLRAAEQILGE
jgi:monoamine oxidase